MLHFHYSYIYTDRSNNDYSTVHSNMSHTNRLLLVLTLPNRFANIRIETLIRSLERLAIPGAQRLQSFLGGFESSIELLLHTLRVLGHGHGVIEDGARGA